MKKIIISFILIFILISTFACVADNGSPQDESTTSLTGDEPDNSGDETSIIDDLPDKNFNGATYKILIRTNYEHEFDIKEADGDLMHDAIYMRNRAVEERFNIEIDTYTLDSEWANSSFNNAVTNSIMAGDDEYSIIAGYAAMILGAIQPNYFLDWYTMPYINLNNPWWSEQIADCFTINNKLYAMTGDIALSLWESMITIFYNKQMAVDYGINNLYDLVINGNWTFDQMAEMCKDISQDLNGDDIYDKDDLYGYASVHSTAIDAYLAAFDIQVLKRNAEGWLEFTLVNDKTINALEKLNKFFHDGTFAFMTPEEVVTTMFKENRALFYPNHLKTAETLRDMDNDFGVLPYPKYDDTQEKYYTTSTDGFSLFLIPSTVKDKEMVGIITEALCAESNKNVVPIYYDVVLKDKFTRDEESSQMLDIIRDNLIFDIGYINSFALDTVGHIFVNLVRNNSTDIMSQFASVESSVQGKLETMLESYQ